MTQMQVKVNIHESLIKKIKVGQKAEIRIDAFPNIVFVGTVKSVSQLADSTPSLDERRRQGIPHDRDPRRPQRPRAQARHDRRGQILVGELNNVLVVPVQAVAEHKGEFFAFVDEPGGIKLRKVKIGENNEKHVEILDGLKEGEQRGPRRPPPRRRRVQVRREQGELPAKVPRAESTCTQVK